MNMSDQQYTLDHLEEELQYTFQDQSLLARAMTHSSVSVKGERPSNERLEFLGDAVLDVVICEHLFSRFPELEEGTLSEIRSIVASTPCLNDIARELELEQFCDLSKGIRNRSKIPDSILANLFEAVVAAIYLDDGLQSAEEFVLTQMEGRIKKALQGQYHRDFKSRLQQFTQKKWNRVPEYEVISETGPDHDKHYEAIVRVQGDSFGPGSGSSKQKAEQEAARQAIEHFDLSFNS